MLQKIDELTIGDHFYLTGEDECYYFCTYTAGEGYNYSSSNRLILNFKKTMDKRGHSDWKYKEMAINRIASMIEKEEIITIFPENSIFVPMPGSKCKNDPMYDDRLTQVLTKAYGGKLNCLELLLQKTSCKSFHLSGDRRDKEKIKMNMYLDKSKIDFVPANIVVFDDVVTTGAHFKAAKELFQSENPSCNVFGLFIARRATNKIEEFKNLLKTDNISL